MAWFSLLIGPNSGPPVVPGLLLYFPPDVGLPDTLITAGSGAA
jgi:hypothetical protein